MVFGQGGVGGAVVRMPYQNPMGHSKQNTRYFFVAVAGFWFCAAAKIKYNNADDRNSYHFVNVFGL